MGFIFLAAIIFWFSLPRPLFRVPYARVVYDKNGELLGARIATDGQWRLPPPDSVPYKFKQCIIQFEDEWFYKHPGINPVSLTKALITNIKTGKTVRGGSTISMQVIRMARHNPPRTYSQKLIEILLALRLEMSYSKDEILRLYAAHAPFGGNVVGLEAAAWRYFGRPPDKLSWGESAALAVLPNAPAMIYPGKNREKYLRKRNRLLDKLYHKGIIDSLTCVLAKAEPLPGRPKPLPRLAPHLLEYASGGKPFRTSIDVDLQQRVLRIMENYYPGLKANKIHNMAVLVVDIPSGKVLVYAANTPAHLHPEAADVDLIRAPRSTGSLLKPFLYAWAYQDGLILPRQLLKDIPTEIAGYRPENFNHRYDGMVPASEALARSLNIPAVRLLRRYGLNRFHDRLRQLSVSTIDKPASHYGLSLILGGAEISLWEAVRLYAGMARSLYRYNATGSYYNDNYTTPVLKHDTLLFQNSKPTKNPVFGAGNIWFVFKALSDKDRPLEGADWDIYTSARKIAWKTGTSYGHRDAWCVGVTPQYAVGVWVGNASGEGRPGLTGSMVAAPLMFDVFKILPRENTWFEMPSREVKTAPVCVESGHLASVHCPHVKEMKIPLAGERTLPCPYHRPVQLDSTGQFRVHAACYDPSRMQTRSWFVLPPLPAWYYRQVHPSYRPLPPWAPSCKAPAEKNMDLIYPTPDAKIFLPIDFQGVRQQTVFKAVHRNPRAVIYWHIDNQYLGMTRAPHQMALSLPPGKYLLTLIDDQGEILQRAFQIME